MFFESLARPHRNGTSFFRDAYLYVPSTSGQETMVKKVCEPKKINIFKEGSTISMRSRLSKNILQIGLIESGSLATFWSDWRSVTKVIANFLTPF